MILNAFLDFDTFKEQMISHKKGVVDQKQYDQKKMTHAEKLTYQELIKEERADWNKIVVFQNEIYGYEGVASKRP